MSSRPTSEQMDQLTPLLGSLARLIAHDPRISDEQLLMLLSGVDIEGDAVAQHELRRWADLLEDVRATPNEAMRRTVVETLRLRGLPEASILLAVDEISRSSTHDATIEPDDVRPATTPLSVSYERLEWSLAPGRGASAEIEVRGGPGQAIIDSDQVRVTPGQFGPGTTRLRVEVQPLAEGMIWTTLRLVTSAETLEVPVVAQWTRPTASPVSPPSPLQAQPLQPQASQTAPVEQRDGVQIVSGTQAASPAKPRGSAGPSTTRVMQTLFLILIGLGLVVVAVLVRLNVLWPIGETPTNTALPVTATHTSAPAPTIDSSQYITLTNATGPIPISLFEWGIEPSEIMALHGELAFKVTNKGKFPHNIRIKVGNDLKGTPDLAANQTTYLVTELPAGIYQIFCSIPGHAEQEGVATIIVR